MDRGRGVGWLVGEVVPPRPGVSRFTILSRFCHVGFSILQVV